MIELELVRRCGACDYDLEGLPTEGRCPECGNVFNQQTGEGTDGDPRRSHDPGRANRRMFAWILITVAGVILWVIVAVVIVAVF